MRTAWRVGPGLLVTAVSLMAWAQMSVGAAQSTGTATLDSIQHEPDDDAGADVGEWLDDYAY